MSQGVQENVAGISNETIARYLATNSTLETNVSELGNEVVKEWSLLWIAVQSYLMTAGQVALAVLMTRGRVIVALANLNIKSLERSLNSKLKAAVGDCFESIFVMGFGAVKVKFLELVHKIDLVEQPLRKVQESIPGAGLLGNVQASISGAGLLGKFRK